MTTHEATARTVTDVLQPRNILLVGLTGIGAAASGWSGIPWGLLAALCAGIIPAAYIERERKRGTWGDRHVVDRAERTLIFFVILASVGIGSAPLFPMDLPAVRCAHQPLLRADPGPRQRTRQILSFRADGPVRAPHRFNASSESGPLHRSVEQDGRQAVANADKFIEETARVAGQQFQQALGTRHASASTSSTSD